MKFIGCGTGRCGTGSLATLIDGCDGWTCTHERLPRLPWNKDEMLLADRVEMFKGREKFGDVAFFYINYLEELLKEFGDLRVVAIERDIDETVESYLRKVPNRNHWIEHDGSRWRKDPIWDKCYPKYNLPGSLSPEEKREQATRQYWHDYYDYMSWLQDRYDRVRVYPMKVLNEEGLQRDMFDFIGIEEPNLQVGLKTK